MSTLCICYVVLGCALFGLILAYTTLHVIDRNSTIIKILYEAIFIYSVTDPNAKNFNVNFDDVICTDKILINPFKRKYIHFIDKNKFAAIEPYIREAKENISKLNMREE